MDNVLIDRSASGFEFRRWAAGDDVRSLAMSALLPPDTRSIYSSLPYVSSPLMPPFQYAPHLHLNSWLSLPPPLLHHPRRHPMPPSVAATTAMAKHAASSSAAAKGTKLAAPRRTGPAPAAGEYKRKKPPRTPPRTGEEPPRAQRRKPLERATPLPPASAVHEALDDLERQVTRGFVEDLMHALAPPPSSLPLPTFSLVKAATPKAVPSCAV